METLTFKTPKDFEVWLKAHHTKVPGVWVRILKKAHKENSGEKSITYAEALDVALCYGWIDSQSKSLDDKAYTKIHATRTEKYLVQKEQGTHRQTHKGKTHGAHRLRSRSGCKKRRPMGASV